MTAAEDGFLKDLQKQCAVDSQEYVTEAREVLPELSKNPIEVLDKVMKSFHSLKGNVQAVGFSFCGQFVHEIETRLTKIKEEISATEVNKITDSLMNLEFQLSNVLQSVEKYLIDLSNTLEDTASLLETYSPLLNNLSSWMVKSTKADQIQAVVSEEKVSQPIPPNNRVAKEIPPLEKKEALPEKRVFLLCVNQGRQFGIPVTKVVEVVQFKKLNIMPAHRADLMGLMNLRGEVMPILDLKLTFGECTNLEKSFIVICNVDGVRFGFPIEQAQQIDELNVGNFQKNDRLSGSGKSLVSHISISEKKTVLIVDVDRIIAA
ncbi:MAG: hypothetical protein A4S09_03625 [Proteobacteria bacterium SG_bin7]|nr:MAG: hypothetical protein A4S09_03625 [Proteobacteria bacterium SG_bin7]